MTHETPKRERPYEGNDMISFIIERGGLSIGDGRYGVIKSMTNVHDTAIIVMERAIFRASPCWDIGFQIEMVSNI